MKFAKQLRAAALGTCSVIALLPLTSRTAFAQAQTGGIETVVVTAEKVKENVNDVGMSINAISGDQLLTNGITDPSSLSKSVPGFTYTRSSYGQPVYTMRGIGFYDTAFNAEPGVSVYLDEAPLPYSAMTTGTMFDLAQAEVLKGPQGTLFGENSTGGAINFIAAKPTDTFTAGADLMYKQYDETVAQGFVSGPISDTVSARLAVSIDEGGAWQKSYTRDATTDATHRIAARFLLDWHPTSDLTFSLNINGWKDDSQNQAGQVVALVSAAPPPALVTAFHQYPQPPTNAREADWDPNTPYVNDNNFFQASLRGEYNLGGGTLLTSITTFDYLHEASLVDTDGMNVESFQVANGGHIETFSQELRLSGEGGGFHWIAGANFETNEIYEYGDPYVNTTYSSFPFPEAVTAAYERTGSEAVFGNVKYNLTDTLTLEGGIRYTSTDIENTGCTLDPGTGQLSAVFDFLASLHGVTANIPPGGCATLNATTFEPGWVVGKLDQDNLSWKGGADWKVTPDTLLYANVSRGYKAGDFSPAGAIYSTSLEPAVQETVLAYEVGAKSSLLDNTLQLNAAAFYYNYGDKQFRGKQPSAVLGSQNVLLNIPESRVEGAEVDATWVPIDALQFNVGASYTNSRIQGTFNNYDVLGNYENLAGEQLPQTPEWQISGDAQYNFPITPSFGGFAGVHLTYQGSQNSALGNLPLFECDPYMNIDLRLGAQSTDGHWAGSVFVNNVTNKYSWNFVNYSGTDAVSRFANLPRIWGIKLDYRY